MKAPWSALAACLLLAPALAAPGAQERPQRLGSAPSWPPLSQLPQPEGGAPAAPRPVAGSRQGNRLRINGLEQQAAWLLEGDPARIGAQVWLPLEVLQGQLGFSSRARPDGTLELEWFGGTLLVPPAGQRALDDEVAVDGADLLRRSGVRITAEAGLLSLSLPAPRLLQVRSSRQQQSPRRLVLDLEGAALMRRETGTLLLDVSTDAAQRQLLQQFGLPGRDQFGRLQLALGSAAGEARVFTLGQPARVVIDLPVAAAVQSGIGQPPPPLDPRLQSLLGRALLWDRRDVALGGRQFRINAISLDPRSAPLELRALRREDGMEGLSLLPNLARRWDALVAINGGYFNRVRRLPLGALRDQGRWLSGPILNRGAMGWEAGELPRFGRLQLQEWLLDSRGGRWPLLVVNSGYVQRGLSRYTSDWGALYRAISSGESGVRLRDGRVVERLSAEQLAAGVPIAADDTLVVGRGGSVPPWSLGEILQLESRPSDPLGSARNVIGGGPLLLLNGQVVLQGAAEGFSSAFLSQGAPRTVIGGDGSRLLLLTLEGLDQPGPTLAETALLLQRLGVRDALNLDGGSSTGLVMGGTHAVKGRGVAAQIHHGLGLVPRPGSGASGSPPPLAGSGS
ncbi:MAG: phosphodiester glycosidase family protein [Cyanobium sp.]